MQNTTRHVAPWQNIKVFSKTKFFQKQSSCFAILHAMAPKVAWKQCFFFQIRQWIYLGFFSNANGFFSNSMDFFRFFKKNRSKCPKLVLSYYRGFCKWICAQAQIFLWLLHPEMWFLSVFDEKSRWIFLGFFSRDDGFFSFPMDENPKKIPKKNSVCKWSLNMSKFCNLHKRKSDLLYICCQSPKFRKQLLKHADGELVKCICKSATKVLDGTLPITKKEKNKLKKYKRTLRYLMSKGECRSSEGKYSTGVKVSTGAVEHVSKRVRE
jgi:hypothetical protein